MPNRKKKSNYDPNTVMKELVDSVVLAYSESGATASPPSLRQIADEFDLNPLKVRKLLITAGVYQSDIADNVMSLYREKKSVAVIMVLTVAAIPICPETADITCLAVQILSKYQHYSED